MFLSYIESLLIKINLFTGQIVSLGISIILPSVGVSMYFYSRKSPIEGVEVVSNSPQLKHEDVLENHSYTNHAVDLSPEDNKQSNTVVRRRFEELDADAIKSSKVFLLLDIESFKTFLLN